MLLHAPEPTMYQVGLSSRVAEDFQGYKEEGSGIMGYRLANKIETLQDLWHKVG